LSIGTGSITGRLSNIFIEVNAYSIDHSSGTDSAFIVSRTKTGSASDLAAIAGIIYSIREITVGTVKQTGRYMKVKIGSDATEATSEALRGGDIAGEAVDITE
jgi:hypothetical protein